MGCGQSTSRDAPSSSTAPRALSPNARSSLSSTRRNPVPYARSTTAASTTSQHASAPTTQSRARGLRLKEPRRWYSSSSPPPATPSAGANLTANDSSTTRWTTALLARERTAFFHTRVTGRPEIWQAIQLAVELARDSRDLKGAAGILEAAGCTVQRGRLEEGVWDEMGGLYSLPEWVVSDPADVVVVGEEEEEVKEMRVDGLGGEAEGEGDVTEAEEEGGEDGDAVLEGKDADVREAPPDGEETVMEEKSEKKGKGKDVGVVTGIGGLPPASKDAIKVRARLSDRGTDVVVAVEKDESVKMIVRRIQEKAEMPPKTKVRLLYMGRMLNENVSLVSQGWQLGHVVNALVFT